MPARPKRHKCFPASHLRPFLPSPDPTQPENSLRNASKRLSRPPKVEPSLVAPPAFPSLPRRTRKPTSSAAVPPIPRVHIRPPTSERLPRQTAKLATPSPGAPSLAKVASLGETFPLPPLCVSAPLRETSPSVSPHLRVKPSPAYVADIPPTLKPVPTRGSKSDLSLPPKPQVPP
jgi:hypothetical protein